MSYQVGKGRRQHQSKRSYSNKQL